MIPMPFIRIAIRYLAAAMVAWGWLAEDQAAMIANDADLVQAVAIFGGAVAAVITERWYWLARKFGWEK